MDWELVGVAGEWVSAVAVVASLLYLGRQIHQANMQSRATARYSFLDAYGIANGTIAGNPECAAVMQRGMAGEALDEAETLHFTVLVGQFLNTWSVMFDLHNEKQLPEGQWTIVRTDLHALLGTVGGRRFWEAVGRPNVSPEFAAWVDQTLDAGDMPYDMLRQRGLARDDNRTAQ